MLTSSSMLIDLSLKNLVEIPGGILQDSQETFSDYRGEIPFSKSPSESSETATEEQGINKQMAVFEIWMVIIGLSMKLGAIIQSSRIYKRKKSDDVALSHSLVIVHGQSWWLAYGCYKNILSLIVSNIIGICFSVLVFILVASYRTDPLFRRKHK